MMLQYVDLNLASDLGVQPPQGILARTPSNEFKYVCLGSSDSLGSRLGVPSAPEYTRQGGLIGEHPSVERPHRDAERARYLRIDDILRFRQLPESVSIAILVDQEYKRVETLLARLNHPSEGSLAEPAASAVEWSEGLVLPGPNRVDAHGLRKPSNEHGKSAHILIVAEFVDPLANEQRPHRSDGSLGVSRTASPSSPSALQISPRVKWRI